MKTAMRAKISDASQCRKLLERVWKLLLEAVVVKFNFGRSLFLRHSPRYGDEKQ